MLAAAIAGTERDQTRVLGVGQRHPRLGDLREAGHRSPAGQHVLGRDNREIGAPAGQRRLGRGQRQDQRRGQQRRQLGERDGGQLGALRDGRLGAEPRRFDAKRGRRIGQVADHRGGQKRHHRDRYRARQRVGGGVAPGEAERHRAAPRQHHAQRPVRHRTQPRQIVVVDEFGGERQDRRIAADEQHRFAASQRDDRRVERPARRPAIGQRWYRPFNQKPPLRPLS